MDGWDGEAGQAAGAAGHMRMMPEQVAREEPRELRKHLGEKNASSEELSLMNSFSFFFFFL